MIRLSRSAYRSLSRYDCQNHAFGRFVIGHFVYDLRISRRVALKINFVLSFHNVRLIIDHPARPSPRFVSLYFPTEGRARIGISFIKHKISVRNGSFRAITAVWYHARFRTSEETAGEHRRQNGNKQLFLLVFIIFLRLY